ncbi:MAG: shikimate dehydrogenase [Candidatus Eisenbacteria bacterium]
MIDGETRLLGVIGDPVAHSLSPAIQNAALEHFHLNARYLAFTVKQEHLRKMMDAVRVLDMPGLNVTLPHKEKVLTCMDEVSERAKGLGAVNTVVQREGRLVGDNTDYAGFDEALRRVHGSKMKRAVLYGSGGAARAVLAVLRDRGFGEVAVACRKARRGKAMIDDLGCGRIARVVPWDRRETVEADLLVNATTLGLKGKDPLPVSARVVRHAKGAIDLVVRPRGTRWVALARSYGVMAEEGSAMLVAQGRESFRLWFGKKPPIPVMERALRRAGGEGT